MKTDCNHGHVYPRADGMKAKCGGPTLCRYCQIDLRNKNAAELEDGNMATGPLSVRSFTRRMPGSEPKILLTGNVRDLRDHENMIKGHMELSLQEASDLHRALGILLADVAGSRSDV